MQGKRAWLVFWVVVVGTPALAARPAAMVLSVAGEVSIEAPGTASRIEPFIRLLEGDRIKLQQDGALRVVYPSSGREEHWSGNGVIVARDTESHIVAGTPRLEVQQLPARLAQQLARMPSADSSGKVGMVRMRAIQSPQRLAALERYYATLRSGSPADDRTPELYLLSGLFEEGAFDRLKDELGKLERQYPDDPSIKVLVSLYGRAMRDAVQGGKSPH